MEEALDEFDKLVSMNPRPSISSINALLTRLLKMKCYPIVLSLYNKLKLVGGVSPTLPTFGILFSCCYHLRWVDNGFAFLGDLLKQGLHANLFIFNPPVNCLCKQRRFGDALIVMPQMGCTPDVVTYNTIINGLCKGSRVDKAAALLDTMSQMGCPPDVVTYSTVIDGLCKEKRVTEALDLFDRMPGTGCSPDFFIYNTIINGLCKERRVNEAAAVLNTMYQLGCPPDVVTYNTVIDGLCKEKRVAEALNMVDRMPCMGCLPSVVTYNTIIAVLAKIGAIANAMKLLHRMVAEDITPDIFTYTSIIHGYTFSRPMEGSNRDFQGDGRSWYFTEHCDISYTDRCSLQGREDR